MVTLDIFGAPLKVNGAAGNIQDNLPALHLNQYNTIPPVQTAKG